MKKLWMRVGVNLMLSDSDAAFILSPQARVQVEKTHDTEHTPTALIAKALRMGHFEFSGDSYIPGSAIEDYNRANGTKYLDSDIDSIDLDPVMFQGPGWREVKGSLLMVTFSNGRRVTVELEPGMTVRDMVCFINGQKFNEGIKVLTVERRVLGDDKIEVLYDLRTEKKTEIL